MSRVEPASQLGVPRSRSDLGVHVSHCVVCASTWDAERRRIERTARIWTERD
jgi:hypothetical protein